MNTREFIFDEGAHFKSCHASTLARLPSGEVVAAWFAGTREGNPDVGIWLSIRSGGAWSTPRVVAGAPGLPHWNPVLFHHEDVLWLFYRVGLHIPTWRTLVMRSIDGGRTWSPPEPLPGGILGPIKNKPILMSNGEWLCGSSREDGGKWSAWMEVFDPRKKTWREFGPLKASDVAQAPSPVQDGPLPGEAGPHRGRGIIQPTLWESRPGSVHALMRSDLGWIYRADSDDFGRVWTAPRPTALVNPNCGIDLARLAGGRLVLAHNPTPLTPEGGNGKRTPLVLSVSEDNGATWRQALMLEEGEGEFSYPSLIASGERVEMVYTWKRATIAYRVVTAEEV
jgi:predicted neuraminidase